VYILFDVFVYRSPIRYRLYSVYAQRSVRRTRTVGVDHGGTAGTRPPRILEGGR